jgi:hypothetical protein
MYALHVALKAAGRRIIFQTSFFGMNISPGIAENKAAIEFRIFCSALTARQPANSHFLSLPCVQFLYLIYKSSNQTGHFQHYIRLLPLPYLNIFILFSRPGKG